MAEELRGTCGVDCTKCDVYHATLTDDDKLRTKCLPAWQKTAKEHWGKELTLADINCKGCIGTEEAIFSPTYCPMPRCAKKRGFTSCGQCPDWKTCGWLSMLHADCPEAREYLLSQE
ncbi:DUF3795 domain-containing protein [candidate division WOR-3 bacterium]|uniref:DUF3795 domain-containing protein n=1 Tax=candidate division WOR-3 bacterium TaxID=2052148 RepID=A0A9D5K7F2_UNCW3|nr:DUF3795 domain-containing protein [candidate division WOR-3 bacterium]MBD3363723.1 DUF3795 domain-containing protein [candidate division WOR-3 bacterium]